MTPDDLRRQLEEFCRARSERDLERAGRSEPPSPTTDLEARFSDLFRPEALRDAAAAAGGNAYALERWSRFMAEGIGRRGTAQARRELELLLAARGDRRAAAALAAEVLATERRRAESELDVHRVKLEAASGVSRLLHRLLNLNLRGAQCPEGVDSRAAPADDLLPAGGSSDLWRGLVAGCGFLRPGDGRIERRRGTTSGVFPVEVPGRVVRLETGEAGIVAYAAFLSTGGEALAWAHLSSALPAEDRRLPGHVGAGVYGSLFARRLHDGAWLEARGLAGTDMARVRGAARLAWVRRMDMLIRRALLESGERVEPPPGFSDEERQEAVIDAACGRPSAAGVIEEERLAALLDELLRSRFGRRWDESRRAGGILREIWSVGWGRPVDELISSLGTGDPEGELLMAELAVARRG